MRSPKAIVVLCGVLSLPVLAAPGSNSALPVTPAASATRSGSAVVLVSAAPMAVSASAVMAAASEVRADPLLGGKDTVKYLRFKTEEKKKQDKEKTQRPDRWWLDLLESLGTGMRIAIWVLGAGLLIWVLLRMRDWVQLRGTRPAVAAVAPTHVGSLDIRPESLPDDVGAAARGLWQQGEPRAALSLLYRGALSRLVHVHAVPIRAASTESDCLTLAAPRLSSNAHRFLSHLVAGWQTVAYAGRPMDHEDFERLCSGFDAQLGTGATA